VNQRESVAPFVHTFQLPFNDVACQFACETCLSLLVSAFACHFAHIEPGSCNLLALNMLRPHCGCRPRQETVIPSCLCTPASFLHGVGLGNCHSSCLEYRLPICLASLAHSQSVRNWCVCHPSCEPNRNKQFDQL
jgi:hypothetical protein